MHGERRSNLDSGWQKCSPGLLDKRFNGVAFLVEEGVFASKVIDNVVQLSNIVAEKDMTNILKEGMTAVHEAVTMWQRSASGPRPCSIASPAWTCFPMQRCSSQVCARTLSTSIMTTRPLQMTTQNSLGARTSRLCRFVPPPSLRTLRPTRRCSIL